MMANAWPMRALFIVLIFARSAYSQFTTSGVDINGNTVIEQIATNPLGQPIGTLVISTVLSSSSTSTPSTSSASTPTSTTTPSGVSTTSTSSTDGPQGPVGQPSTTPTDGTVPPTTFVFTTTDLLGQKTVVTSVFTPTYEPTSPNPSVPAGTILQYSAYSSQNPQQPGSGFVVAQVPSLGSILAVGVSALGILVGRWLVGL